MESNSGSAWGERKSHEKRTLYLALPLILVLLSQEPLFFTARGEMPPVLLLWQFPVPARSWETEARTLSSASEAFLGYFLPSKCLPLLLPAPSLPHSRALVPSPPGSPPCTLHLALPSPTTMPWRNQS